jgi:NTE family protein
MADHRDAQSRTISLALSGGAARGGFHLGAVAALQRHGFTIAALSGTSIGAIVGAGIAAGKAPEELLDIFTSKAFKRLFRFKLSGEGLLRVDRRAALLREIAPIARLEEHPIPLYVTAVAPQAGEIRRFDKGETIPILLASAAIFPLFEPVIYNNEKLIDGGIYDNLPVKPLLALPHPIWGINLHPNTPVEGDGYKKMLRRTLFLSWHASIREQIGQCDRYLSPPELNTLKFLGFKDLKRAYALGDETMGRLIASAKP